MQGGSLGLQLVYSESERAFKVHEKWLSQDAAVQSLGLLAVLADYDVILHTVKTLFRDGLQQVLSRGGQDHRRAWDKRYEICRNMEQRLLNLLRMSEIKVETTRPGSLTVSWPSVQGWSDDTPITIQLHSTDHCSHLEASLLAEDGQFYWTPAFGEST